MDATTASLLHGLAFFLYVGVRWADTARLTWSDLSEGSLFAWFAPSVLPVAGYVVLYALFVVAEVLSNVVDAVLPW